MNRLTSVVSPGAKTVFYEYYRNGLRKKLTYPDNTYITYSYDTLKRLIDIRDPANNLITRYTYDGISSRRQSIWYQSAAMMEYAYDALNRIKSIKNKTREGAIFSQFDYTYNKVGNRLTMTSKEGLHRYYYDNTYQLIDVNYPDLRTGHYEYDVMGNRVYVDDRGEALDYTLKPNGLNQYDAVSKSKHNIDVKGTVTGTSPTVKVNGFTSKITGTSYVAEDVTLNSGANTLTATATNTGGSAQASVSVTLDTIADKLFTYDGNGSLTRATFGAKQVDYTYDYENRLTRIVIASVAEGNREAIYKYDFLGRRIQKDITQSAVRSTQYYIYDGDNIIAEYDSSGALTVKYIYGPNIDEPIRMERLASPAGICYYHFDALGSVTDLSNSSGQQVEHYTYSPFGKTRIYNASGVKLTDSAYSNYYRFTARQWDSESGLYYYRARMYDPNLGRFLQADPVGYSADINLYRYCSNNPGNRIDPLGLDDNDPHKRPDETWDHYWARMRAAQAKKFGEPKLERAQHLADLGMTAAALRALGYTGPIHNLNGALGIDDTNKYFDSQTFWSTWGNSVLGESLNGYLIALVVAVLGPPPFDLIAAGLLFCASSGDAIKAYKEAWTPVPVIDFDIRSGYPQYENYDLGP